MFLFDRVFSRNFFETFIENIKIKQHCWNFWNLISKFNQSLLNLKIEDSSLIQAHLKKKKKKTSTIDDAFQVHFCKLSYHFLDNNPFVRVERNESIEASARNLNSISFETRPNSLHNSWKFLPSRIQWRNYVYEITSAEICLNRARNRLFLLRRKFLFKEMKRFSKKFRFLLHSWDAIVFENNKREYRLHDISINS